MTRVYNFSAGPAALPAAVLTEVQHELLDWHGTGLSVVEMSHRGKEFNQIIYEAEHDLRALMKISKNYKVLFLHGGASLQFAMVPLNLLGEKTTADYVETGHWSRLAIKEAKRHLPSLNIVASSQAQGFNAIPPFSDWRCQTEAAYLHYTSNETIAGVQFPFVPSVDVPLVSDMSSDFLSREIELSQFGLIYASAQKNIGPSGLAVVIIREDLLGGARAGTPTMLDYQVHADADSRYNTPPTFAIYVAGLVFKWLLNEGGIHTVAARNQAKARLLYDAIDASEGFYSSRVEPKFRSITNVVFHLPDSELEEGFIAEAAKQGLVQLKGHRALGGIRASIYNAMPYEGVAALAQFMNEFALR